MNVYQRIWHHLEKVPGGYAWRPCTGWVKRRNICTTMGTTRTHRRISRKQAARWNLADPNPSEPEGSTLRAIVKAVTDGDAN